MALLTGFPSETESFSTPPSSAASDLGILIINSCFKSNIIPAFLIQELFYFGHDLNHKVCFINIRKKKALRFHITIRKSA